MHHPHEYLKQTLGDRQGPRAFCWYYWLPSSINLVHAAARWSIISRHRRYITTSSTQLYSTRSACVWRMENEMGRSEREREEWVRRCNSIWSRCSGRIAWQNDTMALNVRVDLYGYWVQKKKVDNPTAAGDPGDSILCCCCTQSAAYWRGKCNQVYTRSGNSSRKLAVFQ